MDTDRPTKYSASEIPALFDLVSILLARLSYLWNFYAFANLALIGWLVSVTTPWSIKQKVAVTTVYIAIAAISFEAIRKMYRSLESVLSEINEAAKRLESYTKRFKTDLETVTIHNADSMMLTSHLCIDLIIIFIVWGTK